MRQVCDTLIWLAMILVVAGVIYVMPQVAKYVDAATGSDFEPACVTCHEISVPEHQELAHHHH
jgi:hypothetical protein